ITDCYLAALVEDMKMDTEETRCRSVVDFLSHAMYTIVFYEIGEAITKHILESVSDNEFVRNFLEERMIDDIGAFAILCHLRYNHPGVLEGDEDFWKNHQPVYDKYASQPYDKNTPEFNMALKRAIIKLHNLIYSKTYDNHPFMRDVSILDGNLGVRPDGSDYWRDVLILAGVPEKC